MIFIRAWVKAIIPANINAGFRVTGMYTYNLSIIPSETFAPVGLSQNDSPVPGTAGTNAPTERNTEMYSTNEDDDGPVERDKNSGSSQGTQKITLLNMKFITRHFMYALKRHNKGKKTI
jgi:hypothetical protein